MLPPVARSCSSRASSTQIVVLNDDRVEPFGASQFQPPSDSCSASSRLMMPPDILAKVGASRRHLAVDAWLHLAFKEGIAVAFRRPATLPRHAVADEAHRTPRLRARGIEPQVAQQPQDVHRGVPPTVPRCAGPRPVGLLQGEQPRAPALGGDPRALGRDFSAGAPVRSRITCQRIDGSESSSQRMTELSNCRGLPFGWIGRHLSNLPIIQSLSIENFLHTFFNP